MSYAPDTWYRAYQVYMYTHIGFLLGRLVHVRKNDVRKIKRKKARADPRLQLPVRTLENENDASEHSEQDEGRDDQLAEIFLFAADPTFVGELFSQAGHLHRVPR